MLEGITRIGLFPSTSRTVRKELSILMVFAPTMMASKDALVLWRSISVAGSMYFIRILLELPFLSVSLPSAVISDIISTWGRSGDSGTG